MEFITAERITAVLTYDRLIPKVEEALKMFSSLSVVQPVRNVIVVEGQGGLVNICHLYNVGYMFNVRYLYKL